MKENEEYYLELIEEFYDSLRVIEKNEAFGVKIRGWEYVTFIDMLTSSFQIENDGNRIGSFKEVNRLKGYDESAFMETTVPNNNLLKERINITSLPSTN